jgi:hypothetical protein
VNGRVRLVRRLGSAAALVAAVVAVALAAACGDGGEPAPTAGTPQSLLTASPLTLVDGGQGGVTVQVTWVTQELLASPEMERADQLDLSQHLAFYVQLDTDSGDLSKYDLSRISVLRDLSGGEYQPEAWLPWNTDSSHREGLLLFHRVELSGDGVELVIRGLGGVTERSYRWFAPPEG